MLRNLRGKAVIGGMEPKKEKKSVKLLPLKGGTTATTLRLEKVVFLLGNKALYENGRTYRRCVRRPHVPMRAACVQRRIPILVVGSAARHVNAC